MSVCERNIVNIDPEKCNGCGICVDACHEGAIRMVDGKARLVSDIYCDGLGDCLKPCPTGAITIVTRKADPFDARAVAERMKGVGSGPGECRDADALNPNAPCGVEKMAGEAGAIHETVIKEPADAAVINAMNEDSPDAPALPCGCPGGMSRTLRAADPEECSGCAEPAASQLMNWPVQLKLVPPGAPYLKGTDILLAADCAAVAVPDFHQRFLRGRPVIIACPKLEDNEPQIAKLEQIIRTAKPESITVLRMEVPCCGGLVRVAEEAIRRSGLPVKLQKVIVGIDGLTGTS